MKDWIWGIVIVVFYVLSLVVITRSNHSIHWEDNDVDGED